MSKEIDKYVKELSLKREDRIIVDQEQKELIKKLRHNILDLCTAHQKEMEALVGENSKLIDKIIIANNDNFSASDVLGQVKIELDDIAQKRGLMKINE